jgi:hypothetical protein
LVYFLLPTLHTRPADPNLVACRGFQHPIVFVIQDNSEMMPPKPVKIVRPVLLIRYTTYMPIAILVFPDTTRPEREMQNVLNALPVNIAMLKDWNNAKHAHRAELHQIPNRIVALLAKRDSMQTPPIRNANRVRRGNIQHPELWHARIAIQERQL